MMTLLTTMRMKQGRVSCTTQDLGSSSPCHRLLSSRESSLEKQRNMLYQIREIRVTKSEKSSSSLARVSCTKQDQRSSPRCHRSLSGRSLSQNFLPAQPASQTQACTQLENCQHRKKQEVKRSSGPQLQC